MIPQIIEIMSPDTAADLMKGIGTDLVGIRLMKAKAVFKTIKLFGLKPAAANILKQEMLALGGEAAVSRGVINCSAVSSNVLLFGTLKQFYSLAEKLKYHQFGLQQIANKLLQALVNFYKKPGFFKARKKKIRLGKKTIIMGVLNVTPDSFSDAGQYFGQHRAIEHGLALAAQGADIIDVGGESTRPGSLPVTVKEELRRIIPVITSLAKKTHAIISVDTYKAAVAEAALKAGADMVNDISGLKFDQKMAKAVKKYNAGLVLMHIKGKPKNMQKNPVYQDVVEEVLEYLNQGLEIAKNVGILSEHIAVDPGIGFGKTLEHNLEILNNLPALKVLGCPILVGTSRKSFIGRILKADVNERFEGTLASVAIAIAKGADMVRVHEVKEIKKVAKISDAILRRN